MPVVIPEFVYIVGLFFAVVGYMVARGLLATWTHSIGYLLQWLAGELTFKVGAGFFSSKIDLGGPFRAADHFIVTALQNWCAGAEIEMGYFLHGSEHLWRLTAESIDYLARETSLTFDWIAHVHLPKWAKWAALAAVPPALLARLVAHAVAQLVHVAARTARTVVHETRVEVLRLPHALERRLTRDERAIAKLAAAAAAAAGTIAIPHVGGFASPWPEIRGLTRRWWRLARRVSRLEALLGVTAMAAAMANVFGLPNWRCLTRGNVGRTMRHLCGLDEALLGFLLAGTMEALIVTDICDFAYLLTQATEAVTPGLLELVAVEDALIGCHGATAPPPLTVPALNLPRPTLELALAA